MAKSMPSMIALLGLLAVAGYQNRDKLGSVLGKVGGSSDPSSYSGAGAGGALGGALANGASGLAGMLSGGLSDLLEHFNGTAQASTAQSWVRPGDNAAIGTGELEQTLGAETIATLQAQTGLSKQELLERLASTLPQAVDQLTPDGRLPDETEISRLL